MNTELEPIEEETRNIKMVYRGGGSDTVYGLGMIGALVYYMSQATTFREGVRGFFKALFWPAFMVHAILKLLKA